jgi:hypothetical protein
LGSFLLWRRPHPAGWLVTSIGALLLLLAGFVPAALKYLHAPWMMLSLALGWIMSRLLLTVLFFLVITPIGLLQRAFGKRSIETALDSDATSYWQSRTKSSAASEYEKQF